MLYILSVLSDLCRCIRIFIFSSCIWTAFFSGHFIHSLFIEMMHLKVFLCTFCSCWSPRQNVASTDIREIQGNKRLPFLRLPKIPPWIRHIRTPCAQKLSKIALVTVRTSSTLVANCVLVENEVRYHFLKRCPTMMRAFWSGSTNDIHFGGALWWLVQAVQFGGIDGWYPRLSCGGSNINLFVWWKRACALLMQYKTCYGDAPSFCVIHPERLSQQISGSMKPQSLIGGFFELREFRLSSWGHLITQNSFFRAGLETWSWQALSWARQSSVFRDRTRILYWLMFD